MTTEKRLYRSRNALVGGVCAGLAEYFNFDPLVARILTVVLTLSTAGLFAVAYVALWAVLPVAPSEAGPVEVEPHSVRSDTYGPVDYGASRSRADDAARAAAEVAAAQQHLPYDAYAGTGHAPPEPPTPEAAAWAHQAHHQAPPGWQPGGWSVPAWQPPSNASFGGQRPDAPQSPFDGGPRPASAAPQQPWAPAGSAPYAPSAMPQQPAPAPAPAPSGSDAFAAGKSAQPQAPGAHAASHDQLRHNGGVKVAVLVGAMLLFLGIAGILGESIEGVSWWQFWPLVFSIIGIVQMVVPGEPGHRMAWFVDGLVLFCLGGTLLFMSLGVVGWSSIPLMFVNLWPVLLVMGGLFIIGRALHSPWLMLAAGLAFAFFCFAGLTWFSVPGPHDFIVLTLPFGREFSFPFRMATVVVR